MKNVFLLLLLVIMISCNQTAKEEQTSPEQLLRIPYTSTIDNAAREYFVYLPKNYGKDPQKKWPVLMFLHEIGRAHV